MHTFGVCRWDRDVYGVCVCVCECALCNVWLHPCLAVGASGPLTGAVGGLLDGVADPGGVPAAVQLHRAALESHLPAALAEARVRVDVVVVDAGRGTLAVAGHDVDLRERATRTQPQLCCTGLKRHRPVVNGNQAIYKQGRHIRRCRCNTNFTQETEELSLRVDTMSLPSVNLALEALEVEQAPEEDQPKQSTRH